MASPTSSPKSNTEKSVVLAGENPVSSHYKQRSSSLGSAPKMRSRIYSNSPSSSAPKLRAPAKSNESSSSSSNSSSPELGESPRQVSPLLSPRELFKSGGKRHARILRRDPKSVAQMSRSEVKAEIEKLQEQINGAKESRFTMNAEKATMLPQLMDRLKEIQDETLVDLILEGNDIHNMQACLRLSPQSIIEPKELFSILLKQIKKSESEEKTEALLSFCEGWVHENLRTKFFSSQDIEAKVSEIIEVTGRSKSAAVHGYRQILSDHLSFATELTSEESPRDYTNTVDFARDILPNLSQQSVENVAHDLLLAQVQLYCRTKPDDLIEKWDSKTNYGHTAEEYEKFTTQISRYIKLCLLTERDFDQRCKIIEFFLKVAEAALENEDYCTAHAIYITFNTGVIQKQLKRSLHRPSHMEMMRKLETLFNLGQQSAEALRNRMQDCKNQDKPYVPLQERTLSEMVKIDINVKVNEEGDYNVEKLFRLRSKAVEYFEMKEEWHKTDLLKSPFRTNLISYIDGCPVVVDEELEKQAKKLSDQEKLSETDLKEIESRLQAQKKYSPKEVERIKRQYQKQGYIAPELLDTIVADLYEKPHYIESELKVYMDALRK